MKIVVLDAYPSNPGEISWSPLEDLGLLTVYTTTQPEQVVERAENAEIIITNKVRLNSELLHQLPKLRFIAVLATGYNIIDCEAADSLGITVSNVPAYSTMSVAQMVFAHILNIYNQVSHYTEENRNGKWSANDTFCYWDTNLQELSSKTIGIIGMGNIGTRVAIIALSFGMKVLAYTSKDAAKLPEGVIKQSIDSLYASSDIISLHCPLTKQTNEMINAKTLAKVKHGAILINTSRGPLVNEREVAAALTCGLLSAYGADVLAEEPPRHDNPLFKCPNAYITPHIAWATHEARERLINVTFDNVRAFIKGKTQNVVNHPDKKKA